MTQTVLIDSIGKHLDALESLVNGVIVLAVASAWAGIRRASEIEAFGTKFRRRHAFFAVATLYLIANVAVLVLFMRLGDLVVLLDTQHTVEGISRLATHPWILNPFSYFGSSTAAQIYAAEGYGLLIVVWWLCNASLSTLMDDKRNAAAQFLLGFFLVIGLGSMWAIERTLAAVLESLRVSGSPLYDAAFGSAVVRGFGAFLGIAVRALIFTAANLLQAKWMASTGDEG